MTFIQIAAFRSDHLNDFPALEAQWKDATEGRRTLLREQVYADHSDPRRYVVVNEFESYESAMVNSDLPETSAMAQEFGKLVDGDVEYTNLDLLAEHDVRHELAAGLRRSMEASAVPDGLFIDDVQFEGAYPDQLDRFSGADAIRAALAGEAPGREFDRWEVVSTENGFVAEYCYRTRTNPSHLSLGVILATVTEGRISRLVVTCAGSWDAQAEARIFGAATAGVAS